MVPPLSLFFANLGQGLSQKVDVFLILSQVYELAFSTKCRFFQTKNPPLSLFLAFLAVAFHNFAQIVFERSLFQ